MLTIYTFLLMIGIILMFYSKYVENTLGAIIGALFFGLGVGALSVLSIHEKEIRGNLNGQV